MPITRAQFLGTQLMRPETTPRLSSALIQKDHPIQRVPALIIGGHRKTFTAGASSFVFDPVTSTDKVMGVRVTSGSDIGIMALVLDLQKYQQLIGKKIAPIDVTLTDTPADFAHRLGARPAIVLGTMIHGSVRDGSILVFDFPNSDARTMRLAHTSTAGSALWRVLPLTRTRYCEIVGKKVDVMNVDNLGTTNTAVKHNYYENPWHVFGCQKAGDSVHASQLRFDRPNSNGKTALLSSSTGTPSWWCLPVDGRQRDA